MPWTILVNKTKGGNLVLENVRERHAAPLQALNGSKRFVHFLVVAESVDFLNTSVIVLLIHRVAHAPTEGQCGFGDVFLITVVDPGGYYPFVLHALHVPRASREYFVFRSDDRRPDLHDHLQPSSSQGNRRGLRLCKGVDSWPTNGAPPVVLIPRATRVRFLGKRTRYFLYYCAPLSSPPSSSSSSSSASVCCKNTIRWCRRKNGSGEKIEIGK
mmetsp:Transcript_3592/g.6670  ORF Transcript_3592/g.6670 Transcript_3592/m.6670 type:complete len:214 (+) Transcript_3592:432-1073(+)